MPTVPASLVDQFEADGVVVVRRAFDASWVETLRAATERILGDPGRYAKDYARGGRGRFFTDHHMRLRDDGFRRFIADSPAVAIAASLLRARKLNLVDEHLLVKEPGTENPTYWHQDHPYYEVRGRQFGSFWIPLDPVTRENGTMRFVKGSHQWGRIFRPIRIGLGEAVTEADAFDGPAPDIDAEPTAYDIVEHDLEPGDCFFFHAATLHAAHPNETADRRRRALSLRFAGEDARWQPRPYIPSQFGTRTLVDGGPLDSEQYPVVWPAARPTA
ncbi:MAG: phytanoyl-CoA dioxygenase family protein [Alphaproteobacteria bacterium]|nr:phytanoyl-CoA dioxygenase family protein [Alphaproteobacteria bacterium]